MSCEAGLGGVWEEEDVEGRRGGGGRRSRIRTEEYSYGRRDERREQEILSGKGWNRRGPKMGCMRTRKREGKRTEEVEEEEEEVEKEEEGESVASVDRYDATMESLPPLLEAGLLLPLLLLGERGITFLRPDHGGYRRPNARPFPSATAATAAANASLSPCTEIVRLRRCLQRRSGHPRPHHSHACSRRPCNNCWFKFCVVRRIANVMDLTIRLLSLTITFAYYSVVRTSSPPSPFAETDETAGRRVGSALHPTSSSAAASAGRRAGRQGTPPLVLTGDDQKQIEEIIDWTMRCRHIQGMSVSIVGRTEGVLMERGYGLANISTGSKVDEHTLFPIASATKAFTSTLLAILIEKHKHLRSSFDWNTPIRKLLGDSFALYDNLLTSHVTLEDLLAHRTGIPDYFLLLLAPYPERLTRKQLIQTHFHYNNHMYALAGYVAEVLEGRPWEDLVRSYLLEPLSMNSTLFVSEALRVKDKMAASYAYFDGKHKSVDTDLLHQVDVAGPAGSIVSTAHDMTKWMTFHLKGGSSPDQTGKKPIIRDFQRLMDTYTEQNVASVRQLNERDLVRPKSPVSDVHVAYDLGWMTNYYRGYKRVWHSGSISTYKSQLWFYPDKDFGIFVASNSLSSGATQGLSQIMYFISDLLLGEKHWFNVSSIRSECSATDPIDDTDLPTDPRPRPHPDFLGVYSNSAFGNVTVGYEATRNALRLSMGQFLTVDLHYNRSDDTFYGAHDGVIWFRRERLPVRFRSSLSGGDVDVLEMPLSGPKETKHCFVKVNGKGTATAHGHAGQSTVNADADGCVRSRSSAASAATVDSGKRQQTTVLAMLIGCVLLSGYARVLEKVLPSSSGRD